MEHYSALRGLVVGRGLEPQGEKGQETGRKLPVEISRALREAWGKPAKAERAWMPNLSRTGRQMLVEAPNWEEKA